MMSNVIVDHITFVLTERCNLFCEYCFERNTDSKSTMKFDVFRRAIELLHCAGSEEKSITFFGGEPLMCSEKIIEWSKWLNLYYPEVKKGVTTNGTLLDKILFRKLTEERVSILLSIDGYGQEANVSRYNRDKKCVWEDWLRNIEAIEDKSLLQVRMTITKKNAGKLLHSVKSFVTMGIRKISFELDYYEEWEKIDLEMYQSQFLSVLEFFYEAYFANNRFYIDIIEKLIFSGIKNICTKCRLVSDGLTVLPNGDLKVCHRSGEVFGNIKCNIEKIEKEIYENEYSIRGMDECVGCVLSERCSLCPYMCRTLDYKHRSVICFVNQFHIRSVDGLITRFYESGNQSFYREFFMMYENPEEFF